MGRQLASSVISYIPIIVTSCVNGEGLEILKTFLFSLPSQMQRINRQMNTNKDDNVEFGIDDIYKVHGVGVVVSGIVRNGTIKTNDTLHLGPHKDGSFRSVTVKSMQVRRKDCSYAFEGQMCSLSLAQIANKNEVRRGMVLLDDNCNNDAIANCVCYSFEASIDVLNNCSLRENSQPIIHIENIRQSAHILHIHAKDEHENGQNGNVVFTFLHCPEFIRCGMKIIIRKSHGPIAIGRVIRILDNAQNPLVPLNSLQKPHRLRMSKSQTIRNYLRKWNLQKKQNEEAEAEKLITAQGNVSECIKRIGTGNENETETEMERFSTSSDNDGYDEENGNGNEKKESVKGMNYHKIFKKKFEIKSQNERKEYLTLKCKQFKIRELVT